MGKGGEDVQHERQSFEIQSKSEVEVIQELVKTVDKTNPDFIITEDGDSFSFPYLIYRAEQNGIEEELSLGREPAMPLLYAKLLYPN